MRLHFKAFHYVISVQVFEVDVENAIDQIGVVSIFNPCQTVASSCGIFSNLVNIFSILGSEAEILKIKIWQKISQNFFDFFGHAGLYPISHLALEITTLSPSLPLGSFGCSQNYRQSTEKWRVLGVAPKIKEGGNIWKSSSYFSA
jgi:hypothetical protein